MRHEKHLESKNCDFLFRLSAAVRQSCQRSRDLQFLCLGLLFAVMGRASDSVWALSAGSAAYWLRGNKRFIAGERYAAGTVYMGLGLATALTGSKHK